MSGASVETVYNAIAFRLTRNWGMYFPNGFPEGTGIDDLSIAITEVASAHAGCEELGSSDISIMADEVLRYLAAY